MSNPNSPFGFRYFGQLNGASPTEGLSYRQIASTYGSNIFQGDPVLSVSTGYIQLPSVTTTQVTGIMSNLRYLNTNIGYKLEGAPYWPTSGAGSNGQCGIIDDPDAMFLVQCVNTAVTFANIGQNIGWASGTGSTTTGLSAYSVDYATVGNTSALPFRVVGLYSQFAPPGTSGTDNSNPYNIIVVSFNSTDRRAGITGI